MSTGDNMRAVFDALASGGCLTVNELVCATGLTRRPVSDAAAKLIRDDLVERVERGCFRISAAGKAARANGSVTFRPGPKGPMARTRPVAGSFRAKAWGAMRLRQKFTVADLVTRARTDDDRMPENNATYYLRGLAAAGYVRVLPLREPGHKPTSNGFRRYALIRDTGPLAPVIRKGGTEVYDPNTGEVTPCAIG